MSRAQHARRTPTLALAAVGTAILIAMAFVIPDALATEDPEHNSGSEHTLAVTKLPKFEGRPTKVLAINDHGVAVGFSDGEHHNDCAVVWEDGELRTLENLPGGTSARAVDINNNGQVVGRARTEGGAVHAVLWNSDGEIRDLGTLTGDSSDTSYAHAINDNGQVVGASHHDGSPKLHAFLWEDGHMRDIEAPGVNSEATDVNIHGDILGTVDNKPFLFRVRNGEFHVDFGHEAVINALNDSGDVAGSYGWDYASPHRVATWWRDGHSKTAQDLRHPNGTDTVVNGMNEQNLLVGVMTTTEVGGSSTTDAVLWDGAGGPLVRLSPVEGHTSAKAVDVNNNGVVVGSSTGGHGTDPVIWR